MAITSHVAHSLSWLLEALQGHQVEIIQVIIDCLAMMGYLIAIGNGSIERFPDDLAALAGIAGPIVLVKIVLPVGVGSVIGMDDVDRTFQPMCLMPLWAGKG